jgi:protein ImuB
MPFACLYVPNFPVEALLRSAPALRSGPVAVLDGKPPLVKVIAANEAARKQGIAAGMTKLEAEACRGLHLEMRSLAQEESVHAALLDCAHAFSPAVEDTNFRPRRGSEVCERSPYGDTVILDLAGLEHLFGSPQKIARDLASRSAQMGIEAHVAVATNPDASMHAARGFAGVTVIPEGEETERLSILPVEVLSAAAEILETLDRWGVRTFHDLAILPDLALSERLGQVGLELQRLARGECSRPLVPVEPVLSFEESLELEHPIALLEPLSFVLNRLVEQLCGRLSSRSLAANELKLWLTLDPAEIDSADSERAEISTIHERTIRLPVAMNDSKVFLKLLQLDLQEHAPQAPVTKITIAAEPARPRIAQTGLFYSSALEPERLELTLARIAGIVGSDHVGAVELLDLHQPDAFRIKHFFPPKTSSTALQVRSLRAALRRFRPPLPARVALRKGAPSTIFFAGIRAEVVACAGPWRASGNWWSEADWQRDEWDVALMPKNSNPQKDVRLAFGLYRLYRDINNSRWFVEGSYD